MRRPSLLVAVLSALAACGTAEPAEVGEDILAADPGLVADDAEAVDELGDVADEAVLEEVIVDDGGLDGDLDGDIDDEVDDAVEELIVDEDPSALLEPVSARAAPSAITRNLRVLHWNIAGGKENGCQTAGITRAVLRYVRQHDIDFVGLNEVCPSQYRAIKDALRRHWGKRRGVTFSAYVGDDTGTVVGNAIFSRRRFDTISRQKLGQDRFGDRYLLCGRVAVRKHLRFCSAHLTPGDATARRQLAHVVDRIEGWWHDRRDTVILSGDLNITPNDRALNEVYAAGADTNNNGGNHGHYRELDDDDGAHCRGYGERSHAGNAGPCGEGAKIDFIFARANRIVDGDYQADTLAIPGDCTGACSDHRAVVGRAQLRIRVD